MKRIKQIVLVGATVVFPLLVGAQESTAFTLPGQEEGTGLEKYELADRG